MVEDLWKASSITRSAYEKGEAEGKAEGEARGELKGLRKAIEGMLASRFGPLSQEVIQALSQADEPMLMELAAHVAIDTLEQIREQLGVPV